MVIPPHPGFEATTNFSFHRILAALIREQPTEDLANLSSRLSPNISAVPRLQQCNRLKAKPSVIRMLYSKRLPEEIMYPPIAKALSSQSWIACFSRFIRLFHSSWGRILKYIECSNSSVWMLQKSERRPVVPEDLGRYITPRSIA